MDKQKQIEGKSVEFGIQECSKCTYKLRCEECVYNKRDIQKIIEETRKETAEKIYRMADEIATGGQNDGVNILCAIAKEFGL